MKNREYYKETYNKKWNNCLEAAKKDIQENGGTDDILADVATEIFENSANAEEIAGFYITFHGGSALKDWTDNTTGISFSEQDKEVDRILRMLF